MWFIPEGGNAGGWATPPDPPVTSAVWEVPGEDFPTARALSPPAMDSGGEEDVLHLYASSEGSLYSPGSHSPSLRGQSDYEEEGSEEPINVGRPGIFDTLLEAARDLGLPTHEQGSVPPPPQDIWAGTPPARATPFFPVAQGFVERLRGTWDTAAPQGDPGRSCGGIRGIRYAPDTGLGWMPPVERDIALLTSLPPEKVSHNPAHSSMDGKAADKLLSLAFNASMRAARAGNLLAILLAAARRQVGGDNARLVETLTAALSVQSYVTRDIGDSLGRTVRLRRHLWLAETALPAAVRSQLVALPVEPDRVFHTSTRAALEQTGEARRARDKICGAFRSPRPSGSRAYRAPPRPVQGGRPWPSPSPSPSQPQRGQGRRSFRQREARGRGQAAKRRGGAGAPAQ